MTSTLQALQDKYKFLVNTELPNLAKSHKLPVHLNHCFARILLDGLFEDCWYNHLDRHKVAYKQLNHKQLMSIIKLAETFIKDPQTMYQYNKDSLNYRQLWQKRNS